MTTMSAPNMTTTRKEANMATLSSPSFSSAEADTERLAWEATTTGALVDGVEVTIADLRTIFDLGADPIHWKRPWAAYVPANCVSLAMEAVRFFHGERPAAVAIQAGTGKVLVEGRGYICD